MNEFNYEKIKGLCAYFLWKSFHDRHLEDCVQSCCEQWLQGRTNVQWAVIEYCRQNGIGERGKVAARPMENATFVGLATDESSDTKENGFLFDKVAAEKHEDVVEVEDISQTIAGRLEEFLVPMQLTKETFKWVKKIYRPRLSKKNEKIFNTLRTLST